MKERRQIKCSGCKEYQVVTDAGYFINASINEAGMLAMTQLKVSTRHDQRGFMHFVCGDDCALELHSELMKKMSGDVVASPNSANINPPQSLLIKRDGEPELTSLDKGRQGGVAA